jgi:hypothetical protein
MSQPPDRSLEGAWGTETYVAGGSSNPVEGVLLLVDGHWSTLYSVPGLSPDDRRTTAEAGRYEVAGDRLTFHHVLAFTGGGGRATEMRTDADREEVCRSGRAANSRRSGHGKDSTQTRSAPGRRCTPGRARSHRRTDRPR